MRRAARGPRVSRPSALNRSRVGEIAERNRDEDVRGGLDQLPREVELDGGFHRHVEQQERERPIRAGRFCGGLEERARDPSPPPRRTAPRIAPAGGRGPVRRAAVLPAPPASTRASINSCSVRASARGKPGVRATGPKYSSPPSREASNVARAATASPPIYETGAMPRAASTGAARRAASWATLNRWRPIAPPRATATARARLSAAPRDAETMRTPGPSARADTHARASERRCAASDASMRRRDGWRST